MNKIWDLKKFGVNVALLDDAGHSLTYADLSRESASLAAVFPRRSLVFFLAENTLGSVLGYAAFLNNNIVPVMVSSHLEATLLNNLLKTYSPEFIWLPESQGEQFGDMERVYAAFNYVLLRTGYEIKYPLYDELALLVSTSGSTGSAKMVRQSYGNILANTRSIAEYLRLDDTERPITTLPMNYVYGLSIINSHLWVGATILLTDKGLMQKEFWQFFKDANATSFGGVPYTYEMLDKLRFYRMKLPGLKTMTQAGGKITPELQEKFAGYAKDSGKKFVVMYGAAEATARMGYLPADKSLEKCGSMGIPIPGGKFTLLDAEGREIARPFTAGELIYEGENVALGYAEKGEDLSLGDERRGKLATGDMAQFDEDGFYYIVGRKKRFLKIYGNRINLDEVERLIKGEFNCEVACAGTDDHLYIFLTEEKLTTAVKEFAVKKTKLNPAAFKTMVIEEIPKNESGKTLYKELAKYYEPSGSKNA